MVVLYVTYKKRRGVDISVIAFHGYKYVKEDTKYRPSKYVTDKGYTKSKTTNVVNPIKYIDGYITTKDEVTDLKGVLDSLSNDLDSNDFHITGHFRVIQIINNDLKELGYNITTKLLSDTTDFGMDIVTKIIEIGYNNYNKHGKVNKLIKYNDNNKDYYKKPSVRHNLLHHNHVFYNEDTDRHTHIIYGYKNEFIVGKPTGDSYYGIAYIRDKISEIDILRDMVSHIRGSKYYTYTIKLRILYLNTYFRLYRIFGDDVFKFVYNIPDSKRDKSRMLRGIQMLDTMVLVVIDPPGLIKLAFKQLKILQSINKIYHLTEKSRDILKFKFIDIKDEFLTTKKNKKGKDVVVYNDKLTNIQVDVKVGDIEFKNHILLGIDILPKNNLKKLIMRNDSRVELIVEKIGNRVFRTYTLVDTTDERLIQCAYYSGVRYVK